MTQRWGANARSVWDPFWGPQRRIEPYKWKWHVWAAANRTECVATEVWGSLPQLMKWELVSPNRLKRDFHARLPHQRCRLTGQTTLHTLEHIRTHAFIAFFPLFKKNKNISQFKGPTSCWIHFSHFMFLTTPAKHSTVFFVFFRLLCIPGDTWLDLDASPLWCHERQSQASTNQKVMEKSH